MTPLGVDQGRGRGELVKGQAPPATTCLRHLSGAPPSHLRQALLPHAVRHSVREVGLVGSKGVGVQLDSQHGLQVREQLKVHAVGRGRWQLAGGSLATEQGTKGIMRGRRYGNHQARKLRAAGCSWGT